MFAKDLATLTKFKAEQSNERRGKFRFPMSRELRYKLLKDGATSEVGAGATIDMGSGGEVAVHPNVFHHVMDTIPTNGWQIVQDTNGLTLLLSNVRDSFLDDTIVEQIQQVLARENVVVPFVTVQRVVAIPKGAGGKAPLIKSNLTRFSPKHLQQLAKVKVDSSVVIE